MPKLIAGLPQRLAAETRRQIADQGYAATTIRSVAAGCGISPGAVYNYYPSKEALVAAFMLEDWYPCLEAIRTCAAAADGPRPVLQAIHRQLLHFLDLYRDLFRDAVAAGFTGVAGRYHAMLRSQLAQPLRRFCADDFCAEFIAEAMLTWTIAGKPLAEICAVVDKLF